MAIMGIERWTSVYMCVRVCTCERTRYRAPAAYNYERRHGSTSAYPAISISRIVLYVPRAVRSLCRAFIHAAPFSHCSAAIVIRERANPLGRAER